MPVKLWKMICRGLAKRSARLALLCKNERDYFGARAYYKAAQKWNKRAGRNIHA